VFTITHLEMNISGGEGYIFMDSYPCH